MNIEFLKKELEFINSHKEEINKGSKIFCDLVWNAVIHQLKINKEVCNVTKELVDIKEISNIKKLYIDRTGKSIMVSIPSAKKELFDEGIVNCLLERSIEKDSVFITFSITRDEVLEIVKNSNKKISNKYKS